MILKRKGIEKVKRILWYGNRLMQMNIQEVLHRFLELFWKYRLQKYPLTTIVRFRIIKMDWSRLCGIAEQIQKDVLKRNLDELRIYNAMPPMDNGKFQWDSFFDGSRTESIPSFRITYRNQGDILRDIRLPWELSRLTWLMSFAAQENQSGKSLEVFRDFLQTDKPGYGIRWNSMIEIAMQSLSIQFLSSIFASYLTDADMDAVNASLSHRYYWLQKLPSKHSSANNHRIAELVALISLSEAAGKIKSSQKFEKELLSELKKQTNLDGLNSELASDYHLYVLDLLISLLSAWPDLPQKKSFQSYILLMMSSAHKLKAGFQGWPAFGDSDEASLLGNFVEKNLRVDFFQKILNWLPEHIGSVETSNYHYFKESGFTLAWLTAMDKKISILLDHGKIGYGKIAAHGHADTLAFWLSVNKVPIFVEAGTYSYHSNGDFRDKLRLSDMHNTLTIQGKSLSLPLGPFLWNPKKCAIGRLDHFDASDQSMDFQISARYRRNFSINSNHVSRRIKVDGQHLFILDSINSNLSVESHFILSEEFQQVNYVNQNMREVEFISDSLGRICVSTGDSCKILVDKIQISPSYGVLKNAHRVTVVGFGSTNTDISLVELTLK